MLVLPRTSISTASLAFISSSAACTCSRRASGVGAGSGMRVLMTWAWVVKGRLEGKGRPGLYAGAACIAGVQPVPGDIAGDRRRQPGAGVGARPEPFAQAGGRGRVQRHVQPEHPPGRGAREF